MSVSMMLRRPLSRMLQLQQVTLVRTAAPGAAFTTTGGGAAGTPLTCRQVGRRSY